MPAIEFEKIAINPDKSANVRQPTEPWFGPWVSSKQMPCSSAGIESSPFHKTIEGTAT
jgi:hypothetical protein